MKLFAGAFFRGLNIYEISIAKSLKVLIVARYVRPVKFPYTLIKYITKEAF